MDTPEEQVEVPTLTQEERQKYNIGPAQCSCCYVVNKARFHELVATKDRVIELWNILDGWLPAAAREKLAEALDVDVDLLHTPNHVQYRYSFPKLQCNDHKGVPSPDHIWLNPGTGIRTHCVPDSRS